MKDITILHVLAKTRAALIVLANSVIHASIPIVLWVCFSLIFIVPSQSKEIFRILTFNVGPQSTALLTTQFLWMICALSWWSFMQWNWARIRLHIYNPKWRDGEGDKFQVFLIKWLPRALGALPFFTVAVCFFLYGVKTEHVVQLKFLCSGICFLFFIAAFAIYTYRKKILVSRITKTIIEKVILVILIILPVSLVLFNILFIVLGDSGTSFAISFAFMLAMIALFHVWNPDLTTFNAWFSEYGTVEWNKATTGYTSLDVAFKVLKTSPVNTFFILFQVIFFSVCVSIIIGAFPVELGSMMGAAAIIATAFAAALPILSLLAIFGRHFLGMPLWGSLICLFVFSALIQNTMFLFFTGENVASNIRYSVNFLKDDKLGSDFESPERINLKDFVDEWRRQVSDLTPQTTTIPIVFISSSGGGQKAAFWSSRVLGELEGGITDFHRYVAGISAVSGGSLGSTVYTSLLTTKTKNSNYAKQAEEIIDRDGIGPTSAALLFNDLPSTVLLMSLSSNRAKILERVWERGWKSANLASDQNFCKTQNIFSDDFLCLAAGLSDTANVWIPALLLNGTIQETGERVVMSNIELCDEWDVQDFFDITKGRIKTSTAVMNSARFPYVSPAGIISTRQTENDITTRANCETVTLDQTPTQDTRENGLLAQPLITKRLKRRVIDGGYVDNSGVLTLKEFSREVLTQLQHDGKATDTHNYRPIFIEIENELETAPEENKIDLSLLDFEFVHQFFGPMIGFLQTYSARGRAASSELRQRTDDARDCVSTLGWGSDGCFLNHSFERPVYVKFSLCSDEKNQNVLGWTHSKATLKIFDNSFSAQTECGIRNRAKLDALKSQFPDAHANSSL